MGIHGTSISVSKMTLYVFEFSTKGKKDSLGIGCVVVEADNYDEAHDRFFQAMWGKTIISYEFKEVKKYGGRDHFLYVYNRWVTEWKL